MQLILIVYSVACLPLEGYSIAAVISVVMLHMIRKIVATALDRAIVILTTGYNLITVS